MSTPHAMNKLIALVFYASVALTCLGSNPTFTVDASRPAGQVSPLMYGLMTEEINHSYDGGLYAELVRNRAFLDDSRQPVQWSVIQANGSAAPVSLDPAQPLSQAVKTSLRVEVSQASPQLPAGVA